MKIPNTIMLFFLSTILMFSGQLMANPNKEIKVTLEEPTNNGSYASIANIRGWAVAPSGILELALYIDGEFATSIPFGGARADVAKAFPGYLDAEKSGFSMAYNYKNLSPGLHSITVRAIDNNNDYNESKADFYTNRFSTSFVSSSSLVDLSTATASFPTDEVLRLRGIQVDGVFWDAQLKWDTASQGLKLTTIESTSAPVITEAAEGLWVIDGFENDMNKLSVKYENLERFSIYMNHKTLGKEFLNTESSTSNVYAYRLASSSERRMQGRLIVKSADLMILEVEKCVSSKDTEKYCYLKSGKSYTLRKFF